MSVCDQVFVSLGSNLGDRRANLENARRKIEELEGTSIKDSSAERITEPVDVTDQPEFLNQVLRLATSLQPRELLDALLGIESGMGRVRTVRRGPRTIDLDILFYGYLRIDTPVLAVPHPQVWRRPFFLEMVAGLDRAFLAGWKDAGGEKG